MFSFDGLKNLIDMCDSNEEEEYAVIGNILTHIGEFIESHDDNWVGCEEEYLTEDKAATRDALRTFSEILYEIEDCM